VVLCRLFLQGFSCALSTNGAVSCWGRNDYGQVILVVCFQGAVLYCGKYIFWLMIVVFAQIGDRTQIRRSTPVPVFGLSSGVVSIAVGGVSSVFRWLLG
jgi:hypothetical protein